MDLPNEKMCVQYVIHYPLSRTYTNKVIDYYTATYNYLICYSKNNMIQSANKNYESISNWRVVELNQEF